MSLSCNSMDVESTTKLLGVVQHMQQLTSLELSGLCDFTPLTLSNFEDDVTSTTASCLSKLTGLHHLRLGSDHEWGLRPSCCHA